MSKALSTLLLATIIGIGGTAFAASDNANPNASGQDRVCLVTFGKADTTANADVTGTKMLPRKAAEAQASHTMKVYEYGPNGELTAEACDCLNNPSTRATCNQPVKGG